MFRIPSFGKLIAEPVLNRDQAVLPGVVPGIAIGVSATPIFARLTLVLAFNLLGDGLRDALDPRQT